MPNARCAVPVVSPDARCAAWLRTSVTPVADRGAQTRHWMCLACAAVRPGAARCCPVLLALLSPPDLPQDAPAVPRDVWMKSGWAAPHRHAPGEPYPKSARNSKGGEGRVSSGTCLWEPKVAKADGTTGVAFRASSTGSTRRHLHRSGRAIRRRRCEGALQARYSRLPGTLACHQPVIEAGLAYGEKSQAARTSSMSGGRESGCCRSLV